MVTDPGLMSPPLPPPPATGFVGGIDPSIDLGATLGSFDIQELARSGSALVGSHKLLLGSLFLGVAVSVRMLKVFLRHLNDEDMRWQQELLACFFWAGVVICFQWWSSELMYYVTHLVGKPPEAGAVSDLYYARMAKLQEYKDAHKTIMNVGGALSVDFWATTILRVATAFAFVAVQTVAYMLNMAQTFGLAVLLILGQLVFCLAAIGGFFSTFGMAWLMLFIELCMWSPAMRLLLHFFSGYARNVPQENYSLVLELVICWTYYCFMREVPKLAASLVQGGGAGWMAPRGGVALAAASSWGTRVVGASAAANSKALTSKAWKASSGWASRQIGRLVGTTPANEEARAEAAAANYELRKQGRD